MTSTPSSESLTASRPNVTTRHCSTTCAYRLVASRSVLNTMMLQLRWLYSLRERHLRNSTMRHLIYWLYFTLMKRIEANNIPNSST